MHIERKAMPLVLEAVARLKGKAPVELHILGCGPETEKCRATAARTGIGSTVIWHGHVPHSEALGIMAEGHAFIHSSLLEAASTVVLEALSLGLPVICHDICGMAHAVTAECGIKIPLRNPETSVSGFARAIEEIANDSQLYDRLSFGAIERARELTWDRKVERFSEAYVAAASTMRRAQKRRMTGEYQLSTRPALHLDTDPMSTAIAQESILGTRVNATSYLHAAATVCEWAERRESRYVCVATVSQVMEGHDAPGFQQVMNEADLVTPDGMPLVWGLRLLGCTKATRVYGPDLTPVILERAALKGLPVGFYGGSPRVLDRFAQVMTERFPGLQVAYASSPPFRDLTQEEDQRVAQEIGGSGARILFVGIGNPKQEFWMAAHRGKVDAVMIGVGAAFDFLAGTKPQAPRWMMGLGLEWLFRLATEPRRLWKRYLKHNPRFVVLFALQLLGAKFGRATAAQSGT
jgi:N-acetylglucosaminyldiphosphoundecaprenol N-acetyl-beta-D-mannosaminyltransferase